MVTTTVRLTQAICDAVKTRDLAWEWLILDTKVLDH